MSERVFEIEGMTCAACVGSIERAIAALPGVTKAEVNLALHTARIDGDATTDAIVSAVDTAGYSAVPRDASDLTDSLAAEAKAAARGLGNAKVARARFVIAGVLCAPLLALALSTAAGVDVPPWTRWLQAALATCVLGAGASIFSAAARRVRSLSASMDTLVALGTLTAYCASAYALVTGVGHLHFGPAGMIVTLVLFGRSLESSAQGRTGEALRALLDLAPATARRLDGETVAEVPLGDVRVGDRLRVLPGETVPTDGVVLVGASAVSEALVSGESTPIPRRPGDPVIGGSVNQSQPLVIRVERIGSDTRLARIVSLVARAQGSKAGVERLADRVSAVFVPVILCVALATAAGWLGATGDADRALLAAVAVLVVACPCALGLATPTAVVVAVGAAARAGVLIRDAETLEALAAVTHATFDKTGTLTEGRFQVTAVQPVSGGDGDQLLCLAAAVEASSEHPLAAGIVSEVKRRSLPELPATDVTVEVGAGVSGRVAGKLVRAGSPRWLASHGIDVRGGDGAGLEEGGTAGTCVAVAREDELLGQLVLSDAVRPTAHDAVRALKALGVTPVLLSGDRRAVADAVGAELGIDTVRAEVPPERKLAEIATLQAAGARVAMIGDGLNDAPALAAADVGVAMGQGTDVAKEAADLTLLRDDPRAVAEAIALARRTLRTVRQNLAWAFGYNAVTVPLAVMGVLHPVAAAGAMALSSVLVVANSLRLKSRELARLAGVIDVDGGSARD